MVLVRLVLSKFAAAGLITPFAFALSPLLSGNLVMHDTGGYTMSLYCKFNSRPCHSVYGMKRNGDGFEFYQFKKRETLDQVLEFWGPRGELKKVE